MTLFYLKILAMVKKKKKDSYCVKCVDMLQYRNYAIKRDLVGASIEERFMEKEGVCVVVQYVGPKKRKSKRMSFSGAILDDALLSVKQFIDEMGGKIVGAHSKACRRWSHEVDGKTIWMIAVPFGSYEVALSSDVVKALN